MKGRVSKPPPPPPPMLQILFRLALEYAPEKAHEALLRSYLQNEWNAQLIAGALIGRLEELDARAKMAAGERLFWKNWKASKGSWQELLVPFAAKTMGEIVDANRTGIRKKELLLRVVDSFGEAKKRSEKERAA